MDTPNGNSNGTNGSASLLEEKDIPTDDSYESVDPEYESVEHEYESVEHEYESVEHEYESVDPESADLDGLEAAYAFDDEAFESAPGGFEETAQTPEEKSAADSEAALLQYSGYAAPPEELAAMGASPPKPASVSAEGVESEDDDDDDESLDLDPRKNKTKVGLINSPLSKAAFVGGGGLIAVVAAGMLMGQFGGSKKAQVVEEAAKDPSAIASPGVANEVGTYKTGMALTTQRNLLANAKPQQGQVKPVRRNAVDAKMNTPEQPVPTAAALLPAPATMMSTPLEPLPTAFRSVGSLEPIKPPTVEEAIAKWQALAGLGSYGAVQRGTQSQSFNSNTATGFSNESLGANGMILPPRAQQASLSSASTAFPPASTTTSSRSITQLRANSSVPGMRDTPLATVLTGTSASGRINNSVIVAADNAQSIDPTSPLSPKYLMELTDSIKDGNGAIAIPPRSQLVLAVKTFSPQSGLGELQVVAVIANGKEYQVPTGAMVVRSPAGSLLAFSNRDKGAGFFSGIIPSVLAGISQAGQAINQPQSSTSVSNGGITTNVNSAKPNALAAFAQGAGQNLSQRVQQNAQTAQQQSSSAPKTWELKAGSAVTVYVNSSFEI